MRRSHLILSTTVFALLALTLAACGGSSTTTTTQTVTATETATEQTPTTDAQTDTQQEQATVYTEDTTTIDVMTGDSFTIQLPVNPSTGYAWTANIPMGYVQVSDDILEPDNADNMVGQGTAERWVFSADTPGTGTITFDLLPPGKTTPEKTVTFTVNAS